jgi:hypothetical protein
MCRQGELCYRGPQPGGDGGTARRGFCTERCTGPGTACDGGGVCQQLSVGLDGGAPVLLCTRDNIKGCRRDDECTTFEVTGRQLCTVFDHPDVGPASICDYEFPGGKDVGEACAPDAGVGADGLCASGLCLPNAGALSPRCAELCEPGTCDAGVCELAELNVVGVIRHVPVCVPQATRCSSCTGNPSVCNLDAPRCVVIGAQSSCVSACSPDAGAQPSCPGGFRCVGGPSGLSYCQRTDAGC